MTSPQPLVDVGEATPEQTRPMNVGVQASEPVDEVARADSPLEMIADEERDDLLESELHRIVAGMGTSQLSNGIPHACSSEFCGGYAPPSIDRNKHIALQGQHGHHSAREWSRDHDLLRSMEWGQGPGEN